MGTYYGLFSNLVLKIWNQYLGAHTDSTVRKCVWIWHWINKKNIVNVSINFCVALSIGNFLIYVVEYAMCFFSFLLTVVFFINFFFINKLRVSIWIHQFCGFFWQFLVIMKLMTPAYNRWCRHFFTFNILQIEHVYMRPEVNSNCFEMSYHLHGNLHRDLTVVSFQTIARPYCTCASDIF